jgi:hypothetical protein
MKLFQAVLVGAALILASAHNADDVPKEELTSPRAIDDDEQIEMARLQILDGSADLPDDIKAQFATPEMQAVLNDPEKWRASVKQGAGILTADQAGAGDGVPGEEL